MSGRQIVSKISVQAVCAVALVGTACYLAISGGINGEQFMVLAMLPLAWAYRQAGAKD